jgi:dihydroneopterin triphosphate diphosphatase
MNIPVVCRAASLIVIRNVSAAPEMLLLKRTDEMLKDQWLHVAGGIEDGETPDQTVIRELKEETGLSADKLYSASLVEQFYERRRNCIDVVPVFVAYVQNEGEVVLNSEHSDFQWVTFEKAFQLAAFGSHRRLYKNIHESFVLMQPNPLEEIKIPA